LVDETVTRTDKSEHQPEQVLKITVTYSMLE